MSIFFGVVHVWNMLLFATTLTKARASGCIYRVVLIRPAQAQRVEIHRDMTIDDQSLDNTNG